ncbi:hypothetical protein [Lactiplantibacillus daowaiensis]|uniref:DUF2812 domain-containing protein n=1 Tax=Lactiplantibacillus daowaiensis TaxID=2559918 RepID=A0ABW1S3R1_9LACO|nr:hypothetical protein [Lactiplantibacillus daowaiensis]
MWRYRNFIKGSEAELKWLNQLAKRGWLLKQVRGSRYDFVATTDHYRLFTEYVPVDVDTTVGTSQLFKVLAIVTLKKPVIQVVYSGTTAPELQSTPVDTTTDDQLRLKVAIGLRERWLNLANIWTLSWVVALTLIIMLLVALQAPPWTYSIGPWIWLLGTLWELLKAHQVHRQVRQLRLRARDNDGAWQPTMHVFLRHMPTTPDLKAVADLGVWSFVGEDHKGTYWYDLRTPASVDEIKQALRPLVPPEAQINVMSWLGLWPL